MPLEDARDATSPIRILHAAVDLAGIAPTGPIGEFLSVIDDEAHEADAVQRDTEIAVQLHFSSVAHRTNKIVQGLTVLSAIFFPLTLITGIYGMNFEHMPELHWRYGYFMVLGLLAIVAGGLLLYFKRRRIL